MKRCHVSKDFREADPPGSYLEKSVSGEETAKALRWAGLTCSRNCSEAGVDGVK